MKMKPNHFLLLLSLGISFAVSIAAKEEKNHVTRSLSLGIHDDHFYTLVSATDFVLMEGVVVQDSSSQGIKSVGFLEPGDYMA